MKKRFIVCINNSNENQEKRFIEYIKSKNLNWWHHLKNSWLIIDQKGEINAKILRDDIKIIFNNEYNMVFELLGKNDSWAGFGPKSENVNMFTWIQENW